MFIHILIGFSIVWNVLADHGVCSSTLTHFFVIFFFDKDKRCNFCCFLQWKNGIKLFSTPKIQVLSLKSSRITKKLTKIIIFHQFLGI